MKRKRFYKCFALALTVTMTMDVVPVIAYPTEIASNGTSEELLWPEGEELPSCPPELESLQTHHLQLR